MTKLDQHPFVLDAQQALDRAAKAVAMCEREVQSIEREIDRNMANQIEAFTNRGDPSNPLNKRRKPTTFGKLTENLHTAEAKQEAATAAVQQLEAKLTTARLQAREQILADWHKQYKQDLEQLDKTLDKAAKANQRVLRTYEAAQADMEYTPALENLSWREFNGVMEGKGSDTKLAAWRRSLDGYKRNGTNNQKEWSDKNRTF